MDNSPLVAIGLPIALFIIMVGMGLSLTTADFRRVFEQPKSISIGVVGQLLLIPMLGFAIGWGLSGGIMAAGLVLIAALPGGTTSNLFTYLAKANLALSITLTVIASLVTTVTLPLYVNLALETFTGAGEIVRLPFVQTLVQMTAILIVPVCIGMALNRKFPGAAKRAEPIISKFSALVLALIVIGIIVKEWNNLPGWISLVWLPVVLLNFGSMAIGYGLGKLASLGEKDSVTLSIELGLKNVTIGLMIALTLLQNTELAVPAAIYGILHFFTAFGIAAVMRRNAAV